MLLLTAPNYYSNVNKTKSFQLLWLIYYIVFYFTYTEICIQLHYYRYHKIKQPPGKTSFFISEEKSTEGQNIKTPTAAGSTPTQSSPPGRRGIIASTPSPYSNCLSTTSALRAQGLHIRFWLKTLSLPGSQSILPPSLVK